MSLNLVYITAKNTKEARAIVKVLLEEQLVACVNIFPEVTSMYVWEGNIEENSETVIIAKTAASLCDRVIERVNDIHSYECPCIICLPVSGGLPSFMKWIENSVA